MLTVGILITSVDRDDPDPHIAENHTRYRNGATDEPEDERPLELLGQGQIVTRGPETADWCRANEDVAGARATGHIDLAAHEGVDLRPVPRDERGVLDLDLASGFHPVGNHRKVIGLSKHHTTEDLLRLDLKIAVRDKGATWKDLCSWQIAEVDLWHDWD